jgi:hypothetical protein
MTPAHEAEHRSKMLPAPSLFHGLESGSASDLPSPAQCAVHLEMLQCFATLRGRVKAATQLDRPLDTGPKKTVVKRYGKNVTVGDKKLAEKRKRKWPLFERLAVTRFLVWAWGVERWMEDTTPEDTKWKQQADAIMPPPLGKWKKAGIPGPILTTLI